MDMNKCFYPNDIDPISKSTYSVGQKAETRMGDILWSEMEIISFPMSFEKIPHNQVLGGLAVTNRDLTSSLVGSIS